jgi:hypothetical protein
MATTNRQNGTSGGPRAALGVGLATLVTVLVAVLLTTFSVLALVSARADLRLSDKTAEAMESYYSADSQAEAWLAEIDERVDSGSFSATAGGGSEYTVGATSDGQITITRIFTIDEVRDLIVELKIDDGAEIEILRWQVTAQAQQ